MDSDSPFSLILVGQPELRGTLWLKAFEAIRQRITVRYHLLGLTEEETKAYIRHRLEASGSRSQIFSEAASRAVFAHSRGIPRLINNICLSSMLDALSRGQTVVDEENVKRAVGEMVDS